jgi:hypothetical protein
VPASGCFGSAACFGFGVGLGVGAGASLSAIPNNLVQVF